MPIFLRQSTASQEVPLGYFVSSSDGDTAQTGLTIANTDIKIWKTGATTLASKNSGGGTHIAGGVYYAVLDATDTDTIGPMKIFVHVSGALGVILECCVLDEAVYDSLFGTAALITSGTGTGQLSVSSGKVALASTGLDAVVPTEPSNVPVWAASTIVQWMAWIGALSRNKLTQTATTQTLRNDADNASIATSADSDDNTTHIRGEWS